MDKPTSPTKTEPCSAAPMLSGLVVSKPSAILWVSLAVVSLATAFFWHSLPETSPIPWRAKKTAGDSSVSLRLLDEHYGVSLQIDNLRAKTAQHIAIVRGHDGEEADIIWRGKAEEWPSRGLVLAPTGENHYFCILKANTNKELSSQIQVARVRWEALPPQLCI